MCHNVRVLQIIQAEITEWSRRNFGINASKWPGFTGLHGKVYHDNLIPSEIIDEWASNTIILHHVAPLLGMMEETTELVQAFVKMDKVEIRDAIGDIFIYFMDYCSRTQVYTHTSSIVRTERPQHGKFETFDIFNAVEWDYLNRIMPPQHLSAFPINTMVIALGKVIHANLKRHQGIRKMELNEVFLPTIGSALTSYFLAVRDIYRITHPKASFPGTVTEGLPPDLITHADAFTAITAIAAGTWKIVRERDWVKNPQLAPKTVEAPLNLQEAHQPLKPHDSTVKNPLPPPSTNYIPGEKVNKYLTH